MTIVLIAAALYLVATGLLVVGVRRASTADAPDRRGRTWLLPAIVAVALHGTSHVLGWRSAAGLVLPFFAGLAVVGSGMAALTTVYGASGRMAALGVLVVPVAAAALLAYA